MQAADDGKMMMKRTTHRFSLILMSVLLWWKMCVLHVVVSAMLHRGRSTARSRTPKRQTRGAGVKERRGARSADSCTGKSVRTAENHFLTRLAVAPRSTNLLRAPRLCRTIQTDRVVKRVPQFSPKQCSGALSGIPRSLIHPILQAGFWESIASCYPHDVPAVQSPKTTWTCRELCKR